MATTEFGFGTEENFGFDLPSEDMTPANYTVNTDHTVTPAKPDDFWGQAFDEEQIAADLKADLPPEGEYTGCLANAEQRMNRFEGYPEVRYYAKLQHANGTMASISLTVAPQKVLKTDGSGKVRYEYVLFKAARELFKKVRGAYPTSGEEFNGFIQGTPIVYRCVHERNGKGLKVMGLVRAAS